MSLIRYFLQSSERYGSRPALSVNGATYRYADLAEQAGGVAKVVESLSLEESELVAILAHRSVTAYAGLLGVLLAGRGYVPFNPKFPIARSRHMLTLSGVKTVILDPDLLDTFAPLLADDPTIVIVLLDPSRQAQATTRLPRHRILVAETHMPRLCFQASVLDDRVAYVMFTSGSTGVPKGVRISHANISAYLNQVLDRYQPTSEDRFSQMFDLTFDLSVHDMFLCWASGGCLFVPPDATVMAPSKFIREHRLTFWFAVPSVIGVMRNFRMLKPGVFPSLRYSLFCGEALPVASAVLWQEAAPNSIVENLYGPTETTVAITAYRWQIGCSEREAENGLVPIGRPFPGQRAALVDDVLRPVARGTVGELCLGGSQVGLGYLNQPEMTSRRFVSLDIEGQRNRWYRTGDLAREAADGTFLYVGRGDSQVKVLGYRVELGDVEHAVRQVAETEFVVALPWPPDQASAESIVVLVSGSLVTRDRIVQHCRTELPPYMVPSTITFLERFPFNANGKIDRSQLNQWVKNGQA